MLHITNGDSAADSIRATGLAGEVIAWRDALHEGPTPAGLNLEGMSDVRARFLASCKWGSFPELAASFDTRDAALRAAQHVVLWFEHDLYDQLQLMQILAALDFQTGTIAELICIDSFPGIAPFYGLGQLSPSQIASLWSKRERLKREPLVLGARGWKAVCSPDPTALRRFLDGDLATLRFLRPALERFLEEHPAPPTGLSRTDRQILGAVAAGHRRLVHVFKASQEQESAPFMGDTTLHLHIEQMIRARVPLLTAEPYTLTSAGQLVLRGDSDARELNGVDRWVGGVHFKS